MYSTGEPFLFAGQALWDFAFDLLYIITLLDIWGTGYYYNHMRSKAGQIQANWTTKLPNINVTGPRLNNSGRMITSKPKLSHKVAHTFVSQSDLVR